MILLDGEAFDNDTFESYCFVLATQDDAYYTDADSGYIRVIRRQIEAAMAQGETYLDVSHLKLIYEGRLYNERIIEIQWAY